MLGVIGFRLMFRWLSNANYRALKARIDQQDLDIDALSGRFKRLQGAVYARWGRDQPPEPENPPQASVGTRAQKDQVLREYLSGARKHE